jgi:thioredoxin-like negative regulator of GroEL
VQLGPQLEALIQNTADYRLVKIDIGSWQSAVARQYRVESLPTLLLFDGDQLVDRDRDSILNTVHRAAN